MSALAFEDYVYSPLTPGEFRVIILHPKAGLASAGNTFSIEFVIARFDQPLSYSALSYAWGQDVSPTLVDIEVEGQPLQRLRITKSLECTLRSLNLEHHALWVDALCINQANVEEKNCQVSRMAEIYRRAAQVVIWLGEAADNSDLAIEFMENLSTKDIDRRAADPKSAKAWVALAALMRRRWFTRRWIIQEVSFARNAILRCGPSVVPWARFCEAVALFTEKSDAINESVRASQAEEVSLLQLVFLVMIIWLIGRAFEFPTHLFLCVLVCPVIFVYFATNEIPHKSKRLSIGQLHGVGAHSLIAACDRVFPHERYDADPLRLCTMEALLSYLPEFEATDPRDVVFAIASLAKDYVGFTPDYGQSVVRVYKSAVQQAVVTSGSLNIICHPWAQTARRLPSSWISQLSTLVYNPRTQASTRFPSWILQLSALPFKRNSEGTFVRQHADTLLRLPDQRTYKSSGTIRASASFNDDENRFVLACKGFQVPAIAWLGDVAHQGTIPASWSNHITELSTLQTDMVDRYWRTLVVDRDAEGNRPRLWYGMACDDAYRLCQDGVLSTTELLSKSDQISTNLKEFLKRVQAVTWNRRLVRLEDDSLGLVPQATRTSDRICILFGCDVPVILRRRDDDFWEFIGEAFVYGVMEGEAVNRPYKEVTFNLT